MVRVVKVVVITDGRRYWRSSDLLGEGTRGKAENGISKTGGNRVGRISKIVAVKNRWNPTVAVRTGKSDVDCRSDCCRCG